MNGGNRSLRIARWALLLGLLWTTQLYAYDPVAGGELVDRLSSPRALSRAPNGAGGTPLVDDTANPATSAAVQRVHLGANYTALVGDARWDGHGAQLGIAVPTPAGVFSGSASYLGATYDRLDLGQRGSVGLSFAKELFPSLAFGSAVRMHLGTLDGTTAFGAGVDLGIVHSLGDVGVFQDVRWGVALNQMGWGLHPRGGTTGSPSPFTPRLSLAARVMESATVRWDAHLGVSVPSFQNARLSLGTHARFFNRVALNVGWEYDLREHLDSDRPSGSLFPSVGLSFHFTTDFGGAAGVISDRGWDQSDIAVDTAYAPLYTDVWAFSTGFHAALGVIDRQPPIIEVEYPATAYVSPNNNGAADELILPLSISDQRYLERWELTIVNENGEVVRQLENAEQRPENASLESILDRLLYIKRGVTVPKEVVWDGRTDDGGIAPDGEYLFTISAVDDNGNRAMSDPARVVIDTTLPSAEISVGQGPDSLIFSPNGDGSKDFIDVGMATSNEERWLIEVRDALGGTVRSEEREGAFETLRWDGRDDTDQIVPDGVYSLHVTATDRAQNEGGAFLDNIIVDTEPTPIALFIDRGAFSPNGDGIQDTIVLTPEIPITEGIRETIFTVRDQLGTTRRTVTRTLDHTATWELDGRDDRRMILPEGIYTVELSVRYRNGNTPRVASPTIELDVTPPRATLQSDTPVISPNGDGNLEVVTIFHEAERAQRWEATITDEEGQPRFTQGWLERPEREVTWDGRDANGQLLPDGVYRYTLSGQDRAGNEVVSEALPLTIDTRATAVYLATSHPAVSPNGDGVHDTIDLIPTVEDAQGLERFEIVLTDHTGAEVNRITGSAPLEERYRWDGRSDTGRPVADGTYRARIGLFYRHGNRPEASSAPFVVDTRAPQARVSVAREIFSPDGDGNQDVIAFEHETSDESLWVSEIKTLDGRVVRRFEQSGEITVIEWDGTDDTGRIVTDGTYRYHLMAQDEAGNETSVTSPAIQVDTRAVEIRLSLSEQAFSPNGDGVQDTVQIVPTATINTPVESWRVVLSDNSGQEVWSESAEGAFTPLTWDGRTPQGDTVADGVYYATLTTAFTRGDSSTVRSPRPLTLDTRAPAIELELSSPVISPNDDGELDTLHVTQRAASDDAWRATITADTTDEVVRSWRWDTTPPETLTFDGFSQTGERLPDGFYRYQIISQDAAGNRFEGTPAGFEIYTVPTPLTASTPWRAFSPNGDGVQDDLPITVEVGTPARLQEVITSVRDEAGDEIYTASTAGIPDSLRWDGRSNTGDIAPDGVYTVTVGARYQHGNAPEIELEPITIDTKLPRVIVESEHSSFSPNGDRQRDTLNIVQRGEEIERWQGEIRTDGQEVVRSFLWEGDLSSLSWDGTDEAGNTLPDGRYHYRVWGCDEAGNENEAALGNLVIDTRPTRLFATLGQRAFSPNGDLVADKLEIGLLVRRTDGALERAIEIIDSEDKTVARFTRREVMEQETFAWGGDDGERLLPDGNYRARVTVSYDNGTIATVTTADFSLDTTGPTLSARIEGLPFSPDNDGLNDELRILLESGDASGIEGWYFEISDRAGNPFHRWEGMGDPSDTLRWDGRSTTGESVISAEDYPYRFVAYDRVGNESTTQGVIPTDILVVRDGERLKVRISSINFDPDSAELNINPATPAGMRNIAILDRLVEVFDRYGNYRIVVEGHAVNLSGTAREEREELRPLSQARAERVQSELAQRGLSRERISAVGRGGEEPVVPHTERATRWKNRRVEFILLR